MKEKTATHNNHKHITMSLEDVRMHHSLAVMFQVFPVVKRREKWQSLARITDTAHIIGACGKEWDSPTEVGGERNSNKQQHNHITMSLEDVGMHHSRSVMFQVFPVVKRRENMAVISKNNRYCTHHWGMWK